MTQPKTELAERTIRNGNLETTYSAEDFVNPGSYESSSAFGREQKAFVILAGGFVQAIVFSEYHGYTQSDALDEAVDSGKLDSFQCDESELKDYQIGTDSDGNPEYEGIDWLGNASEPFALGDTFDIWVLRASHFAEEPCLMTPERVMERIEQRLEKAEVDYDSTGSDAAEWHELYCDRQNLRDAKTLARFAQAR